MEEVHGSLIEILHESIFKCVKLVLSVSLDAWDVRPEHSFLDLLDFKADFLAVRRVEHETLKAGPVLQRCRVPLLCLCPESIDEATENDTALDILTLRLLHQRDFVKCAHTDLPKDFIDLLKWLRSTVNCLGHIAVSTPFECVAIHSSISSVRNIWLLIWGVPAIHHIVCCVHPHRCQCTNRRLTSRAQTPLLACSIQRGWYLLIQR